MIEHWLQHPESMGAEAVERLPQLIDMHPGCATYRMLYCIALANTHSTRLNDALQQAACALPDRSQLFLKVNNGEHEWVDLMQRIERQRVEQHILEEEEDDFRLIDQYLMQQHLPSMEDFGLPAAIPSDFPLDHLSVDHPLENEENEPKDIVSERENKEEDDFSLVDQFLSADREGKLMVPQAAPPPLEKEAVEYEEPHNKAFLTESLARLYVKQHKFEQALAIFSQLNLQYSKKNNNFADQIRYLEKVIAAQKESNSTTKR